MLGFVKAAFRGFFEVILWINLILCTIVGGIIGNIMGGYDGHPIIGGLIGLIAGMFMNIVGGGLLATILNMDENIEQLKNNMKSGSPSPQGNISNFGGGRSIVGNKLQKKCKRCKKEVDEDYTGCPHCGNNTFE
ncbi:MAG: hypothetical protein LBH43_17905 [Treponema sp.]|jgi:hypothetical protein|nr:hypothetical protein [Treponema sp.]